MVWGGGQTHPTIVPELLPPPTLTPGMVNYFLCGYSCVYAYININKESGS